MKKPFRNERKKNIFIMRKIKSTPSFYFILIITFSFLSCKKELPKPNNDNTPQNIDYPVEGVNWILTEGRLYIQNLDNSEKKVYDYFNNTITEAQMHVFGSTGLKIDSLKVNYTSWFFSNQYFTLNGSDTWQYTFFNTTYNVIGLPGGTARPITPTHISENYMTVITHEAYGSDGINNFKYWSELGFSKSGTSCTNCQPDIPYGWVYDGVWSYNGNTNSTITGTKWVVVRYNNGLSGNVYPNDTLDFITDNTYTINNGSPKNYTISNVTGNNNKSLSLYSFSTIGGDYAGQIMGSYLTDGQINNAQFHDLFNVNNTVTIWMIKL